MFCKNCGTQIPDGSVFCSVCGCPVETHVEVTTKKPINKKIIIISVAAAFIIAIGITLLVTLTGYKIDKALVGEWKLSGHEEYMTINKDGTGYFEESHGKVYMKVETQENGMVRFSFFDDDNFDRTTPDEVETYRYKVKGDTIEIYRVNSNSVKFTMKPCD